MKWFWERYKRQSNKNEHIEIVRNIGVWEVVVNNTGQTTRYTNTMWKQALSRQKKSSASVRKALMLGLGAGGQIKQLHNAFPNCEVTVVEYDPEMIAIAKELELYKPFPFPQVIEGDAGEIVPTLKEIYDLILVDLFHGSEPSPLAQDTEFLQTLKKILSPNGTVLINVYEKKEYLEVAKKIFPHSTAWTYRYNHLGAFWCEEDQHTRN